MTGDPPTARIPAWPGVAVAVLCGLVYLAVGSHGTFHFGPSKFHHHVLIADAWLHGQLAVRNEVVAQREREFRLHHRENVERQFHAAGRELSEEEWRGIRDTEEPPMNHDWAHVDGRLYGYWGPLPAALLVPWVAVAGLNASDTLLGCLLGAGAVLLMYLVLRHAARLRFVPGDVATCTALALLLGLGTVHFYVSLTGQVWFLSQTTAMFFSTLAVFFVLRSDTHPLSALAAGAAFGGAVLSRASVVATLPFYGLALVAIARRSDAEPRRGALRRLWMFALPVAGAAAITLAFNFARFGDPLESGAGILVATGGDNRFTEEVRRWGMFSLHFVRRNIFSYFVNPRLRWHEETGALTFDPYGNSMFLVTPAFLFLFRAYRRRNLFTAALWVGAGASLALLLTFHGSGWYGFGNRYLLDLMPLLILLVAAGLDGRLTWDAVILIALSIAVNSWGTYRFCVEQVWY